MASIPEYGARPIGRSNRAIVSDQSGEILGSAVADLGQNVSRIATVRSEREDRFNYARAQSSFLTADIEARRSLENDPDWDTYEKRYREALAKAREASIGLIRSEQDRRLFEEDSKVSLERGVNDVRASARAREIDWGRADLTERLTTGREAALNARDEGTRAAIVNNNLELIEAAKERGYVDSESAGQVRRQWTQDYAVGFITVQSPARRIEILENPNGTPAQFLPSDTRVKMLEAAKEENRALFVRGESQRQADAIMTANESRSDALAAARKLDDAEVRDSVVSRVNQRFNELEAIDAERQDQMFTRASELVEESGSTDGIHRGEWLKLTVAQRQVLERRAQQVKAGVEPETDQALWYSIRKQAVDDQQAFVNRNLLADRPSLSNVDFQSFADLQARIRAGGTSADEALAGVRTPTQIVDDTLRSIGIDPSPKPGSDQANQVARFSRLVDDEVRGLQIATGKKATTDDVQAIVDRLVVKGEVPGTALFGLLPWNTDRYLFEVEPDETFAITDVGQVPASERREIEAALKRAGREVTDAAILVLFNADAELRRER